MRDIEVFTQSYTTTPDGTIAPGIPGQQNLSGFNVGSNGKLLYTVSGKPITALVGTLNVNGSSRTLTHESSGVATISGAAITSTDVPISVTLTSTTPVLLNTVTAVNVINNVPAPPPLVKRSLTFEAPATKTGDTYGLTAAQDGFLVTESVNTANNFEIIYKIETDGNVLGLNDTRETNLVWQPPVGSLDVGIYRSGPNVISISGANVNETVAPASNGVYIKLLKSGSNIVARQSADGITYGAVIKTWNVPIGQYHLRVINAGDSNSTGQILVYT